MDPKDSATSPLNSPRTQTMDRSEEDYDPNRIPDHVFASTPGMEWSTASNESLFSIHMGNSSFSNGSFNMMYSGELSLLDDIPLSDADRDNRHKEEDMAGQQASPPVVPETDSPTFTPRISTGHYDEPRASDCSTRSFAFPV